MSTISELVKAALDIEKEVVEVPQWGTKIEVRSMSAKARANLLKKSTMDDGTFDLVALYPALLIACCFDPDTGEYVFTDTDAEWLNDKSAGPVETLAQVGMRLSGLSKEAVDEGKASS